MKMLPRHLDAVNRAHARWRHRARRLIVVTSLNHRYTLAPLEWPLHARGVALERWSYERFLATRRLPRAAWILTDFDRVHPWLAEVAIRLHDRLRAAGMPVLNDPRVALPRAALLRRLAAEGINGFTCWLPALGERPARFPVFLRTLAGHRGVLGDLLDDAPAAEAALAQALAQGHPIADLCFIEYAAEPVHPNGTFRKHACYIVGERIVRGLTVTDASWVAKHGQRGAATPEDYASERAQMDAYPHAALMRRVFGIAGVGFGRSDFGIVAGRPQIYEVNTNPHIAFSESHPSPVRMETEALIRDRLAAALAALPPPPGPALNVTDALPRRGLRWRSLSQP